MRESSIALLLWDTLRFALWCRRHQIDSCIDLELFSRVTSLLTWATFASNRVGFHRYHQEGLYRGEFLTHKVPYNAQVHIAHNFMNLVESLVSGPATEPMTAGSDGFLKRAISAADCKVAQAFVTEDDLKRVQAKISAVVPGWTATSPIALINANAGEFLPQRKWPRENFVKLIELILAEDPNVFVLLTGAPAERADNDWIANKVAQARCVNFSGCVLFEELPTLYTVAKVLVTNDSGPGHFSSVTKIRSYVFFGPETPALYGSLGNSSAFYASASCSPCVSATNHRKTKCTNNVCLQLLTPEFALSEIKATSSLFARRSNEAPL